MGGSPEARWGEEERAKSPSHVDLARSRRVLRLVATVVECVYVAKKKPSFNSPSKPFDELLPLKPLPPLPILLLDLGLRDSLTLLMKTLKLRDERSPLAVDRQRDLENEKGRERTQ